MNTLPDCGPDCEPFPCPNLGDCAAGLADTADWCDGCQEAYDAHCDALWLAGRALELLTAGLDASAAEVAR